jgi:hypothetical protein
LFVERSSRVLVWETKKKEEHCTIASKEDGVGGTFDTHTYIDLLADIRCCGRRFSQAIRMKSWMSPSTLVNSIGPMRVNSYISTDIHRELHETTAPRDH